MSRSFTRTGDDGTTGRFGGKRLSKASPFIDVLGALDEANAAIGVARAIKEKPDGFDARLEDIQHVLFRLGADLTTPLDHLSPLAPRFDEKDTQELEEKIEAIDATLPTLTKFILPQGAQAASLLHLARAIIRRAERALIKSREEGEVVNAAIGPYLNRLSSYLFVLARWVSHLSGHKEKHPRYKK